HYYIHPGLLVNLHIQNGQRWQLPNHAVRSAAIMAKKNLRRGRLKEFEHFITYRGHKGSPILEQSAQK
ncbi:Hypothetical predicted protein, partial [Pelobates cultripes]